MCLQSTPILCFNINGYVYGLKKNWVQLLTTLGFSVQHVHARKYFLKLVPLVPICSYLVTIAFRSIFSDHVVPPFCVLRGKKRLPQKLCLVGDVFCPCIDGGHWQWIDHSPKAQKSRIKQVFDFSIESSPKIRLPNMPIRESPEPQTLHIKIKIDR